MQNIKPVQAQLEIIIYENGLDSAIATLANAVKGVIMDQAFAYTEERSEGFGDVYEETEEYKNLSLALSVLDAVMQAFDIDESKATRDTRVQLMADLIGDLKRITVTG
jgi:hypothetical protein